MWPGRGWPAAARMRDRDPATVRIAWALCSGTEPMQRAKCSHHHTGPHLQQESGDDGPRQGPRLPDVLHQIALARLLPGQQPCRLIALGIVLLGLLNHLVVRVDGERLAACGCRGEKNWRDYRKARTWYLLQLIMRTMQQQQPPIVESPAAVHGHHGGRLKEHIPAATPVRHGLDVGAAAGHRPARPAPLLLRVRHGGVRAAISCCAAMSRAGICDRLSRVAPNLLHEQGQST